MDLPLAITPAGETGGSGWIVGYTEVIETETKPFPWVLVVPHVDATVLAGFSSCLCYRPAAAARFFISSGETSSLCVAIYQTCPNGSVTPPVRSP